MSNQDPATRLEEYCTQQEHLGDWMDEATPAYRAILNEYSRTIDDETLEYRGIGTCIQLIADAINPEKSDPNKTPT